MIGFVKPYVYPDHEVARRINQAANAYGFAFAAFLLYKKRAVP